MQPDSVVTSDLPPLTSSGRATIATSIVVLAMAVVFVAMRVWARVMRKVSPFQVEDILCYLALGSYFASCVNYICMVVLGGLGYHIAQLQLLHIERFSQTVFIAQILYALVLGFAKLSIATNFQRVFFTRGFRMAAYASMALSIAWMLQTILIGLLICQPVNLNWSPTARGSCGNQTAAFTSVSVVDILTDVVLLVLPIRPLMDLRVKKAQKIALAVIFSGGFITIVVTAIRLYLLYVVDFTDLSFSVVNSTYLTIIQPGIAIAVACGPLLKPVLGRILGPGFSTQKTTSRSGSGYVWPRDPLSSSRSTARSQWISLGASTSGPISGSTTGSHAHLPTELVDVAPVR